MSVAYFYISKQLNRFVQTRITGLSCGNRLGCCNSSLTRRHHACPSWRGIYRVSSLHHYKQPIGACQVIKSYSVTHKKHLGCGKEHLFSVRDSQLSVRCTSISLINDLITDETDASVNMNIVDHVTVQTVILRQMGVCVWELTQERESQWNQSWWGYTNVFNELH